MLVPMQSSVEVLILGAGWTSLFLEPLLKKERISYAATTTTGRDKTIPFKFDPNSEDLSQYQRLPSAQTVIVTFPLTGEGQSTRITSQYRKVHGISNHWVQLGSTGIFTAEHWNDDESPYDTTNARAIAEDELMKVADGCVLNLAGLYGGPRDPKGWVSRVAKTKQEVKNKKALHLIHGEDVAIGLVGIHRNFTPNKRWLLTDLHVYDWWDLIQSWGQEAKQKAIATLGEDAASKLEYGQWVGECMIEENLRALPRSAESLGRVLDSREFWKTIGTWPTQGRVR